MTPKPGHTSRDLLAICAAVMIAAPVLLMVAELRGWVSW